MYIVLHHLEAKVVVRFDVDCNNSIPPPRPSIPRRHLHQSIRREEIQQACLR